MDNQPAKIIHLAHPILHVPAEARRIDYYYDAGRAVGLVLEFADGQRASLTYREIRELQAAEEEQETAVEE